eukprot:750513_1
MSTSCMGILSGHKSPQRPTVSRIPDAENIGSTEPMRNKKLGKRLRKRAWTFATDGTETRGALATDGRRATGGGALVGFRRRTRLRFCFCFFFFRFDGRFDLDP